MKTTLSNKPKGAKEMFGVNVKVDKRLDESSKKSLFPDKLDKINKLVATLKL
jgi:hypothetical protein